MLGGSHPGSWKQLLLPIHAGELESTGSAGPLLGSGVPPPVMGLLTRPLALRSCVWIPVEPAQQRVTQRPTPHTWGCNQPENFHGGCQEMPHNRKLPLATAR